MIIGWNLFDIHHNLREGCDKRAEGCDKRPEDHRQPSRRLNELDLKIDIYK